MMPPLKNNTTKIGFVIAAMAVAGLGWMAFKGPSEDEGLAAGNGRIEATEVDVATKLAGRLGEVLVKEGDFVKAGQPLARMQIDTLTAARDEAFASYQQALNAVASVKAQVTLNEANRAATVALVAQRESELDAAKRRLARSQTLSQEGAASIQETDDNRAHVRSLEAAVVAAKAQVKASDAAIEAAKAQVISAKALAEAAKATVARVDADIVDSELKAPRDGRVQYRIAEPGEVIGGGGKVLNLVDLSDVYMTFFLPEAAAGRLALGSDVRIILDAAPDFVIPAQVSFVASTAQFTPKTVETASERQKLMFRIKARIDPDLLREHIEVVKTGLPGVAWVKTDRAAEWPAHLAVKVPQ